MRKGEQSVLICFLSISLPLMLIFALGQGINWMIWHGHNHHAVVLHDRQVGQNLFWNELMGKAPFTNDDLGHFAKDLQPFVKNGVIFSNVPNNPLLPSKLTDVQVPATAYPNFFGETGLCEAGTPSLNTNETAIVNCTGTGSITSDFVSDFQEATTGHLATLLQTIVPAQVKPFTWWPGHGKNDLPTTLAYWVGAWAFIASLSLLISSFALRFYKPQFGKEVNDDYGRWPNFILNGKYKQEKLAILFMCPWFMIPRALVRIPIGLVGMTTKIRTQRQKRAEQFTAMANNAMIEIQKNKAADQAGISAEYKRAKSNLARLDFMGKPASVSDQKEWMKVYKDTKELVSELEKFPDELSDRAKVLLARQVAAENDSLRDRPKAILEAYKEIDGT